MSKYIYPKALLNRNSGDYVLLESVTDRNGITRYQINQKTIAGVKTRTHGTFESLPIAIYNFDSRFLVSCFRKEEWRDYVVVETKRILTENYDGKKRFVCPTFLFNLYTQQLILFREDGDGRFHVRGYLMYTSDTKTCDGCSPEHEGEEQGRMNVQTELKFDRPYHYFGRAVSVFMTYYNDPLFDRFSIFDAPTEISAAIVAKKFERGIFKEYEYDNFIARQIERHMGLAKNFYSLF